MEESKAGVGDLQKTLDQLSKKMNEMVEAHKEQVEVNAEQVNALQAERDELSSSIEKHISEVKDLKDKLNAKDNDLREHADNKAKLENDIEEMNKYDLILLIHQVVFHHQ